MLGCQKSGHFNVILIVLWINIIEAISTYLSFVLLDTRVPEHCQTLNENLFKTDHWSVKKLNEKILIAASPRRKNRTIVEFIPTGQNWVEDPHID